MREGREGGEIEGWEGKGGGEKEGKEKGGPPFYGS